MGMFWRKGRNGGGGPENPAFWDEARAFAAECRRIAHPNGMQAPIPPQAQRHIFPHLSAADWIRVRVHHRVLLLLAEKGVADPDHLDLDGKRILVSITSPYVLPRQKIAEIVARNRDQLGWIAQDHATWKSALAERTPRVDPDESVGTALARHHPDPGLAAAYDRGAEDLRTGAWRSGESLWFLLPYAVARDGGILIETPPPFAALDDVTRAAVSWMHRDILSGDANIELMSDAGDGHARGSRLAKTGMILAEEIYPFQFCAGRLFMDWTLPDPMPAGPHPVSRHCPCDTALSLFRAARNHELERSGGV